MVSESENNTNLPWVEKYRPKSLNDLIAHEDIVKTLNTFIAEDRIPHLLLYGPPGTGKTSTILAIARKLYSEKEFPSMVLELNASDERGIDIVRGPILTFSSTKTIFKSGFKLVVLDEADSMTQDAQNALRRIMEKYTENTRFCLICNYLSKIIPAIQSRCTRFRFGPLNSQQIMPRLDHIIEKENLVVEQSGKKALIELAGGDMRKVINVLQSTSMGFDVVNEKNVYQCCGQPQKTDITLILQWLLNDSFASIYKGIRELQQSKGIALQDIITQIHVYIHKSKLNIKKERLANQSSVDFPDDIKMELLNKLASIEFHLSSGGSEKLNLSAFISAFQTARDANNPSEMSE